jgi:hypothetical protein
VKKEREDHLRKEIAPNLWKSQPFSWWKEELCLNLSLLHLSEQILPCAWQNALLHMQLSLTT